MQDQLALKCPQHDQIFTLYCDSDSCKTMLCKTCYLNSDHDTHKIYGFGALRELPINAKIEEKALEFRKSSEKLKEEEKLLQAQLALCEQYQTEIEKILSTEIGKTILSQMCKNKDELIDVCKEIMKKVEDYLSRSKNVLSNIESAEKEMKLINLIVKNKTIQENIVDREISKIADPIITDYINILKDIYADHIEQRLDLFKTKLGQSSPISKQEPILAGKRSSHEQTVVQNQSFTEKAKSLENEEEKKEEIISSATRSKRKSKKIEEPIIKEKTVQNLQEPIISESNKNIENPDIQPVLSANIISPLKQAILPPPESKPEERASAKKSRGKSKIISDTSSLPKLPPPLEKPVEVEPKISEIQAEIVTKKRSPPKKESKKEIRKEDSLIIQPSLQENEEGKKKEKLKTPGKPRKSKEIEEEKKISSLRKVKKEPGLSEEENEEIQKSPIKLKSVQKSKHSPKTARKNGDDKKLEKMIEEPKIIEEIKKSPVKKASLPQYFE